MKIEKQIPGRTKDRRSIVQVFTTIGSAVLIAYVCGLAIRADAQLSTPPGLFRGMLHGAIMPGAWPALLIGHDQEIYSHNGTGRLYKLGYSMGVNLSGLIFFGWFFQAVRFHRKQGPEIIP